MAGGGGEGAGGCQSEQRVEAAWGLVCTGDFQGMGPYWEEKAEGGLRVWCPNEQGEGGSVEASASFPIQRRVLGELWGSREDLGQSPE